MFKEKHYIFNQETLSYELARVSLKTRIIRAVIIVAAGFACFFFYSYLIFNIFGVKAPKLAILERRNAFLVSRMEVVNQRLDADNAVLTDIQARDNSVYRAIFGMDEISGEQRNAGFPNSGLYEGLEGFAHGQLIFETSIKLDILSKKACIQSHSFDEVSLLAKRTGEMAFSVPSITPLDMSHSVRITSSYGYRVHPIRKYVIFHEGMDFAGRIGEPIYAAANGTVESVQHNFFGYGNMVVIDHGFGYKTKYAHLKTTMASVGQRVSRGDQIGTLGNSGMSTGPHLHYEVLYKNRHVNPWIYLNKDMTNEEWRTLVHPAGETK